VWGEAQQAAFCQVKKALGTPPVLHIPDFSKEFTLICDANDVAISAVLYQNQGEQLTPNAYASRFLSPAERRYSVHEECLGVVFGCENYRTYLEHREFVLFTENQALLWLLRHAKELGRIGWWVLRLAPFKFRVSHIRIAENVVADCLSRQYEEPLNYVTFSGLFLGQLPEAFHSIQEHQKEDSFCKDIYARVMRDDLTVKKFSLRNGALASPNAIFFRNH
jgi:hypothetical protein